MASRLAAVRSPQAICLHPSPTRLSYAAASGPIEGAAALLDACAHPAHLAQAHASLLSAGLAHSHFLAAKLIHSASELGLISHARLLFDEIPHPNVFLWNAIIKLHSHHNASAHALHLYASMLRAGQSPDRFTFPSVLKACGGLTARTTGRAVHAQMLRFGFDSDLFLLNGLIAVYAKCGDVVHARTIFDRLADRNVISWTSIVSGSVQNGLPVEALKVFRMMRSSGMGPDFVVLVSAVKAYMDLEDLEHGRSVHALAIKGGFEDESDLVAALTAMYAKCGQVHVAKTLFDRVSAPDVILWNAVISGYAKNGYANEAVELFRKMITRNAKPDSITIRSTILACAQVGSLEVAKWMEDYTACSEFGDDVFVNTALIDMYAKCGSIAQAHAIFDRISAKDVVAWSALISGYGMHGHAREAIGLFHDMQTAGVRPNDVTFIGLLSACNHAGLVEEGKEYFHSIRDRGIEPRHQHYACVVDLLARAGHVQEAYEFIKSMPMEPEVSVWGALLTACNMYGYVELGEIAANRVFALDPTNAGHYVQLSNIYASADMWSDVAKIRVMMKERGVTKPIGSSLIEINGKLQSFHAWERSHPQSKEVYVMLVELERKLKESGLVSDTEFIYYNSNIQDAKENSLCNHSERLAIAFGLISTAPGTTLKIIKSLRMCVTCHSSTKFLSKLVDREIVIRDANHFHHFKNGLCSCRDHW